MRLLLLALCVGFFARSDELKGRLVNGTTNQPGRADVVRLVLLSGTMQTVATLTDVEGAFTLKHEGEAGQGSFLVQAMVGSTTYSERLASFDEEIEIRVFDQAEDVPVNAAVGSLAVYAYDNKLDLGFFYNLDNQSEPPMVRAGEVTFRFPLAEGYETLDVTSRRTSGMPLKQTPRIVDGWGEVSYSLKPGRTQFIVSYTFPYDSAAENNFVVPLLEQEQRFHVLAVPRSLDIQGVGLDFVSEDPKEGLKLYEWERQEGQTELAVKVTGQAAPKRGVMEEGGQNSASSQQAESDIKRTPDLLHRWRWWIIASVVIVLGAVSFSGYRKV